MVLEDRHPAGRAEGADKKSETRGRRRLAGADQKSETRGRGLEWGIAMEDLDKICETFVSEVVSCGGPGIRSVVLFGSALGPEFRPGFSDYNFAVLADPVDIALLGRMAERTGKWKKKRISAPLVLTPATVARSLDSYPLEFLSLQARYRLLQGEDFVTGLSFSREHVRLQCERELRSKLLLLRRAFLESEGAPKRLQHLVARGLPSLVAIFRGMIFVKQGEWRVHGPALYAECERVLGLPAELLNRLHEVRGQRGAPSREEIHRRLGDMMSLLAGLADQVDEW